MNESCYYQFRTHSMHLLVYPVINLRAENMSKIT